MVNKSIKLGLYHNPGPDNIREIIEGIRIPPAGRDIISISFIGRWLWLKVLLKRFKITTALLFYLRITHSN